MKKSGIKGGLLTDFDLHLLGEGRHLQIYERLGAHPLTVEGIAGVNFAVWAPNAVSVGVIGDFNGWDGRRHGMRPLGSSGVWELFIAGLEAGALYKYEIRPRGGAAIQKADPYAFAAEIPPKSGSKVWDIHAYRWDDQTWLAQRAARNPLSGPINIYECQLASWRRVPGEKNRFMSYRELAVSLVEYVVSMGYTHIELMPIMEHPFGGSWGYQTTGYYAPTSRHGTPDDFKFFVDSCHKAGLGVILDWVPSHFATDGHGLGKFDGTSLYEHEDPRKGFHPDWGSWIFNYGRNEVRNFLVSNALFWLKVYHVDGLRVDAVASMLYLDYSRKEGEWIPNKYGGRENLEAVDFLREFNTLSHRECPGILTIAEESTAWPMVSRPVHVGGLGFSLKWNMGWMHDMLKYASKEPAHRKYHHYEATFSMIYAYTENFMLVLSHDEVVHGKKSLLDKMPGDLWQKFAGLRTFYGLMTAHPGKKLLFMGGEIGQWNEWRNDASLDWNLLDHAAHRKLQDYVRELNRLYVGEPALYERDLEPAGFEWIDCHDSDNSVFSFIRYDARRERPLIVVCNFTPVPRLGYRVGVPMPGFYREALNSDSEMFGGSNMGNLGGAASEPVAHHDRPHSISITLPPLAAVFFKLS